MRSETWPDLVAMVSDIQRLVECESPSDDHEAIARSAAVVAELGTRLLRAAPEVLMIDGVTHLRWRFGAGSKVLVLGHHDTVWPVGSLASRPFGVSGGVLRGPGCFDMKAGLVMGLHALASLDVLSGVTLLVTGDEEPGSASSRALIEDEARACAAALVLEASGPGGALKTERAGVSRYEVLVQGRAGHAGLEPEKGVNASIEVAHQVLAVAALADPARRTSVVPTALTAGTTVNTVPASARLLVDVRTVDDAEQQRVEVAMRGLRASLPGAVVTVTGGPNRPPLDARSSADLFATAGEVARDLGMQPLTSVAVGGASDGNLTAGVGTPTLDGLGAVGGGAHADDEHVLVGELAGRTRLLAGLVRRLLSDACPTRRSGQSDPVPSDDSPARGDCEHADRD